MVKNTATIQLSAGQRSRKRGNGYRSNNRLAHPTWQPILPYRTRYTGRGGDSEVSQLRTNNVKQPQWDIAPHSRGAKDRAVIRSYTVKVKRPREDTFAAYQGLRGREISHIVLPLITPMTIADDVRDVVELAPSPRRIGVIEHQIPEVLEVLQSQARVVLL